MTTNKIACLEKVKDEPLFIEYDGFLIGSVSGFTKIAVLNEDDHWVNTIKRLDIDHYRLIRKATAKKMFSSLSSNLDELCFTEEQFAKFCSANRSLIYQNGRIPFFLLKFGNEYFVYSIFSYSAPDQLLSILVRRLDDKHIWGSKGEDKVIVYTPRIA